MFPRTRLYLIAAALSFLSLFAPHVFLATERADRPFPQPLTVDAQDPDSRLRGTPLFHDATSETVFYGGTQWDASDARWEAIPGGLWTFESGVASAINTDSTKKAVGLHSLMEGWTGSI